MQKKLFSELGLAPEMKAIGRMGFEEASPFSPRPPLQLILPVSRKALSNRKYLIGSLVLNGRP
jgi:hypothetical protein